MCEADSESDSISPGMPTLNSSRVERDPKFQFTSPRPGHPIHSDAKKSIDAISHHDEYIRITYLPELHGAETSMIIHPLQLKLLESVVVVTALESVSAN